MPAATYSYLAGAITVLYGIAGLFFLKFWHRTRDRLFVNFALAFWLLALNQALVTLGGWVREEQTWIYLLRLTAFLLIIVAIVRKNMQGGAAARASNRA